jgi:phage terminase large subunit-like protein
MLSPVEAEAARRLQEPLWSFRPLPRSRGQTDFLDAIKDATFGVYGLTGGNRSGKSECGAYATARRVLFDLPRKMEAEGRSRAVVWVIYESFEMAGQIGWKQKLERFIHPRNIRQISWHSRAKGWPSFIETTRGVEIMFKSWEQGREAFQGEAIDGAWFDEQFPASVFEEVYARCLDRLAPVYFTLTPLAPDAYLEERYTNSPEGWQWFNIDLNDNRVSRGGHLDDRAVDRLIDQFSDETREARVSGKFVGFEGAIFPSFNRSIHVADFGPEDMDPDWKRLRGIDFGYRNPFCCLWAAQDREGCWWIYDEHYEAGSSIERHAEIIEAKSAGQNILRTWADPGGDTMPTGTRDYLVSGRRGLRDRGIDVLNARKTMWESVDCVRRALKVRGDGRPGIYISGRHCPNLIRELPTYRYETTTSKRMDPADRPVRKNDHAISALRYILFSEEPYSGGVDAVERIPGASRALAGR